MEKISALMRRLRIRTVRFLRRCRRRSTRLWERRGESRGYRGLIRFWATLRDSQPMRYLRAIAGRIASNRTTLRWTGVGTVLVLLAVVTFLAISRVAPERPVVTWTMVNISGSKTLGDAHLLEFANGRNVLIDTGWEIRARQYLIPFLNARGITSLEKVIVTNAKSSKTGGVAALLDSGIRIGSINFNLPPKEVCDAERQWGCRYEELESMQRTWERSTTVWPMETGMVVVETDHALLEVFITHDGLSEPIGPSALADATSLLSLEVGDNRVLFASDLGVTLGGHLAEQRADDLDFNILKVPHFGTWAHAPPGFFEVLAPKLELALVPTVEQLWESERSVVARVSLADVPTYRSQLHGNVEVRFFRNSFEVRTWQHGEEPIVN